MKSLFAFTFSLTISVIGAQPDSLLQLPLKDRYLVIEQSLFSFANKHDSLGYFTLSKELSELAKKSKDKKFQLEIKAATHIKWSNTKTKEQVEERERTFFDLLEKARALNHLQLETTLEYYLAEFYWGLKTFSTQAMVHYEKAYRMARSFHDDEYFHKQWVIYKFGEKYFDLADYSIAILYLKEASKVENPWEPFKQLLPIYNTMGLAFRLQDNFTEAENCYLTGLELATKHSAKGWIGNLSGNLGYLYILKGDVEKGEELLQKDINRSLAAGNSKGSAAGALLQLAQINIERGDFEKARIQVDSSLMLTNYKIAYHRKKHYCMIMSKLKEHDGQWKEAVAYLDSAIVVNDSLQKKDKTVQQLRFKQRVELEESKVEIAKANERDQKRTVQIYAMIACLLLAIGAGIMILRQKTKTDKAKQLSDQLLLNILPLDVAEELKANGSSKAKRFSNVTVLFCDFKSFTRYAEQMHPEKLVHVLDAYFKGFDKIVTQCGLEKIKTVGDAYICVCGLPVPDPRHAEKTIHAALKIQEFMKEHPEGWELRIGIHSGPVVAGIVGITKFAYDIWGDTVNIAARLEQNSQPGRINISKDTFELVSEKFDCSYRGKLDAKNKGSLDMYFVEGALTQVPAS